MSNHHYTRPTWLCLVDGEEWPCKERKLKFLMDFRDRREHLYMLMGTLKLDAEKDLDLTREEIQERFTGWVNRTRDVNIR